MNDCQVLVRPLQLSGALLDAGLEVGVERPDLALGPALRADVVPHTDQQQRPSPRVADDGAAYLEQSDGAVLSQVAVLRRVAVDFPGPQAPTVGELAVEIVGMDDVAYGNGAQFVGGVAESSRT